MYDHLVTKRIFTLTMSMIFNLNLLNISHYLRVSFPTRSGCVEKIVCLKDPIILVVKTRNKKNIIHVVMRLDYMLKIKKPFSIHKFTLTK